METQLAEAAIDATRVARLLASPVGVRVALVNLATGAEFFTVPLASRTRESVAAALGVVGQLRARLAAPTPPSVPFAQRFGAGSAEELRPRPRKRRGLNLVRTIEYTDDATIYTERSGFSGSKAWAAQLIPAAINLASASPRDYDYRFLNTSDRHQSRSGRTGHANFHIGDEPDGVYIAESVWRSGQPQRVYFEVQDGSVTRHAEDTDEARGWMGLTEPIAQKIARLRAEASAAAAERAGSLQLPPLNAVSDKQRAYAERVRGAFVEAFQKMPDSMRVLWPAIARANSASWWLDNGNVQRERADYILRRLVGLWIAADDDVHAIEATATAWATRGFDEYVDEARRNRNEQPHTVGYIRKAIEGVRRQPDAYINPIANISPIDKARRPAVYAAFGEVAAAVLSRLLDEAVSSGELT